MPKDRRLNFLSSDRARASPYACSSKDSHHDKSENSLTPVGDEKEWEEARCPICMEHPHNAVLLLCASRDKGCRPYMCNTSHRHSNCLDQFCKPAAGSSSTELQEVTVARMQYQGGVEQTLSRPTRSSRGQVSEILCPLCRGQINGWVVIENARRYMNSKVRSCSLESCNFTGNYIELRKHARHEHPTVKPSDVDPERQSEWVRLERERDLRDTLSVVQSQFGYNSYDYSPSDWSFGSGMSDDDTEDEWSADADNMLADFEVGVGFTFSLLNEFTYGPSDGARNSSSARTGARSFNRRSMTSRARAYSRGGNTSPRRRNTSPSRSGSEGVRERISGRSLNGRLMRSRSRSNDQVENTNTTPLGSTASRNTGNERTFGWYFGRRSMRSRSRSNTRAAVTSPRMARDTGSGRTSGRSFGSRLNPQVEITSPRRARNSGSGRTSGRSFGLRSYPQVEITSPRGARNTGSGRNGGRSITSRSISNQDAETYSHRRLSSGSASRRYGE